MLDFAILNMLELGNIMKKLLLLSFFLSGCATTDYEGREFVCTSFNAHGTYAKYRIQAPTLEAAQETANQVNQTLVDKEKIPPTAVYCE